MTVAFLVSLLAVAGFGIALWKSGVVTVAQTAVSTAFSGLSAMMDRDLDDDAKEIAVRRAAFSLLKAALSIALRFVFVLAAAALPILIADLLGVATVEAVTALMLRLDYVVLVSVAAIVLAKVSRSFVEGRGPKPPGRSNIPRLSGSSTHWPLLAPACRRRRPGWKIG